MSIARITGLDAVHAGVSPAGGNEVTVVFFDRAGTTSLELVGDPTLARQLLTDAVAQLDAIAAQQADDQ